MEQKLIECTCVIVGGGIAGVSCLETLSFLAPSAKIVLITESPLVKAVTNVAQLSKTLQKFDIAEKEASSLSADKVLVIQDHLLRIETKSRKCYTGKGLTIQYEHICLCTGARPKLIEQSKDNPCVIGIRDTDSIIEFQKRIKIGKCLAIVGNGGIASEIAYEVKGIKIHWIIKDDHISSTFVDPGAAKFFRESLVDADSRAEETHAIKRMRYEQANKQTVPTKGAALGPDWHRRLDMTGSLTEDISNRVEIHYNCEVKEIIQLHDSEFPIALRLTNNELIECDLVVSATGVTPCIDYDLDTPIKYGPDGGIFVDDLMQTSLDRVYAAGDICYAGWDLAPHFFQMRLWTQARQMGGMAAKTIAGKLNNEPVIADFCFELFGHVTMLFGYQVILLGNYNGQGLNNQYEILLRVTPKKEYIKFVLKDGKLQGAILIGETDLAETCENLILNQLDLTPYGDDILDPNIDIEDYFD